MAMGGDPGTHTSTGNSADPAGGHRRAISPR